MKHTCIYVTFALASLGVISESAAQSFDSQPQLTEVTVSIAWSSNAQIWDRCGPYKLACATVGKPNVPYSRIWAEKPAGKRDTRNVCALGHEFLHSLGANHIP
jgi:hypothetical protein